jgi:hypothetical protein
MSTNDKVSYRAWTQNLQHMNRLIYTTIYAAMQVVLVYPDVYLVDSMNDVYFGPMTFGPI